MAIRVDIPKNSRFERVICILAKLSGVYVGGSVALEIQHTLPGRGLVPRRIPTETTSDLDMYVATTDRNDVIAHVKKFGAFYLNSYAPARNRDAYGEYMLQGVRVRLIDNYVCFEETIEQKYDFNFLCSLYHPNSETLTYGPRFEEAMSGVVRCMYATTRAGRLEKYGLVEDKNYSTHPYVTVRVPATPVIMGVKQYNDDSCYVNTPVV